jgi:hypothetical protein
MAIDEVHVAADPCVEQLQDSKTRMFTRHGDEDVGEVLDEGEDQ